MQQRPYFVMEKGHGAWARSAAGGVGVQAATGATACAASGPAAHMRAARQQWMRGGGGAHWANVRWGADARIGGGVEVLMLAEAKVCDLEHRRRALAGPRLLQLDERVLQLEVAMREALLVDELDACIGARS